MKIRVKDNILPDGMSILEVYADEDFIAGWSNTEDFPEEVRGKLELMLLAAYTKGYKDSVVDTQVKLQKLIGIK